MSMQTNSQAQWKLPVGLALAVLTVAAVALIPTVAFAGHDRAAPAAATHDHVMAGHTMAGHTMAGHTMAGHGMATLGAGLEDELAQVRRVTARFHDLDEALEAGYELGWVNGSGVRIITGCVADPNGTGAMGYHYFHPQLMADNAVNDLEPEALVYESGPDGKRELVAVEWVARGPNTNPPGVTSPPSVLGMPMHILVPAVGFYIMHGWVWKPNPAGVFEDWNPEVSCP
jgi:hypothetical protein